MISVAERKIHLLVYNHLNSLRKTSKYTNVSKSSLSRWKKEGGLLPKYNFNKNKNIHFISNVIKIIFEIYPLSTINDIVKIMKEKYPNDESVSLMNERFNADNISESGKSNQYTSYSVNKGEKIVFCIRQKDEAESLVDENSITFVSIHELAHIMTTSVGHTPEFWDNFKRLLKEAIANDLYVKEDYSKNPKAYCGITISDNPIV